MKDSRDIIDFINDWYETNGILTTNKQIVTFVGELQKQISEMDFSLPKGTTVIGYTGGSNGVYAWKIVDNVTESSGGTAKYITNLPAGELLNDTKFTKAISNLVGENENIVARIISGNDISDGGWKNAVRLKNGSCGYGTYLSLDDFVSAKLMGESVGVSK